MTTVDGLVLLTGIKGSLPIGSVSTNLQRVENLSIPSQFTSSKLATQTFTRRGEFYCYCVPKILCGTILSPRKCIFTAEKKTWSAAKFKDRLTKNSQQQRAFLSHILWERLLIISVFEKGWNKIYKCSERKVIFSVLMISGRKWMFSVVVFEGVRVLSGVQTPVSSVLGINTWIVNKAIDHLWE